ncbi:MAG: DUF4292 domain-containing protein [Proteobacteria bacterium]|nr:DUF4292 domain-containing protein [Pseudomonadota bacterium]
MHRARGRVKLLTVLILAFVCMGCARVPRPTLATERISAEAKELILAGLREQDASVQSFRGLARGVLDDGGQRSIVRYVLLFKRPDNLRIEALPSTGAYTLSVLAANASGVVMLDPVQRRGYQSSDLGHALKSALRIPLPLRDLMPYLLGVFPESALARQLDMRRSNAGIQIVAGDFEGYWLLDETGTRLKQVELRRVPHGRPVLRIEYSSYIQTQGWRYPQQLRIEVPGESLVATISFRSAELNPKLLDDSFTLSIPAEFSMYSGGG